MIRAGYRFFNNHEEAFRYYGKDVERTEYSELRIRQAHIVDEWLDAHDREDWYARIQLPPFVYQAYAPIWVLFKESRFAAQFPDMYVRSKDVDFWIPRAHNLVAQMAKKGFDEPKLLIDYGLTTAYPLQITPRNSAKIDYDKIYPFNEDDGKYIVWRNRMSLAFATAENVRKRFRKASSVCPPYYEPFTMRNVIHEGIRVEYRGDLLRIDRSQIKNEIFRNTAEKATEWLLTKDYRREKDFRDSLDVGMVAFAGVVHRRNSLKNPSNWDPKHPYSNLLLEGLGMNLTGQTYSLSAYTGPNFKTAEKGTYPDRSRYEKAASFAVNQSGGVYANAIFQQQINRGLALPSTEDRINHSFREWREKAARAGLRQFIVIMADTHASEETQSSNKEGMIPLVDPYMQNHWRNTQTLVNGSNLIEDGFHHSIWISESEGLNSGEYPTTTQTSSKGESTCSHINYHAFGVRTIDYQMAARISNEHPFIARMTKQNRLMSCFIPEPTDDIVEVIAVDRITEQMKDDLRKMQTLMSEAFVDVDVNIGVLDSDRFGTCITFDGFIARLRNQDAKALHPEDMGDSIFDDQVRIANRVLSSPNADVFMGWMSDSVGGLGLVGDPEMILMSKMREAKRRLDEGNLALERYFDEYSTSTNARLSLFGITTNATINPDDISSAADPQTVSTLLGMFRTHCHVTIDSVIKEGESLGYKFVNPESSDSIIVTP
jgi:hypothetical protein